MNLDINDDQRAILDALDGLAKPFEAAPIHDAPLAATSAELEAALAAAGFLDVALDPDLGTATAAILTERIARLPFAVEVAASAFFRPVLGGEAMPSPLCLVEERRLGRPVRHLRPGAGVLVVGEDAVRRFVARDEHMRTEPEALYAYPMASLLAVPDTAAVVDLAPDEVRTRWQAGLAAEAAGLLAAALASTVAHVSDRQQFGRPLATFQALRHRLAEAQVRTNGVYWLAMKAGATLDPADAALAALHAQETARDCVYDFHQFLGAMGMTLEHPLHLWTYRLKALIGELGGRGGQALAAAQRLWPM